MKRRHAKHLSNAFAAAALAAACAVPAAATLFVAHNVVISACNPCAGCQSPMPGKKKGPDKGPMNPCGLRIGPARQQ